MIVGWGFGEARADAITVLGWSSDGQAVIDRKGIELQKCAPIDVVTAAEKSSCKRCAASGGDAAKECGLTAKPVAGLASPDKKLVLKKASKRVVGQADGGDHWVWFDFPGSPSILFTLPSGPTAPKAESYFRADGNAVVLHFVATGDVAREDDVRVVDVARLHGKSDAAGALRSLVGDQLARLSSPTWAMKSAVFATDEAARGAIDAANLATALKASGVVKPDKIEVALTASGASAFLTFTTTIDNVSWRVTELATFEGGAWKIAGGMWSRGMADADAEAKAIAGQLPKRTPIATANRVGKLAAWIDHVRGGDKASGPLGSIKRKDTITIGTQPKERVGGGKLLDAALAGWRKTGFKIAVAVAESVPHAGWLLLEIELTKTKAGKTFTMPIRAWLAVEDDDGVEEWGAGPSQGVVLAHFAVPH